MIIYNVTITVEDDIKEDWLSWIKKEHIPGGYFKTMHNPETDWCFNTEKEPNCDNRQMVYPRGKTLGGSSSINGMLYIKEQVYMIIF